MYQASACLLQARMCLSRQVLGNHDYGETNGEIPTNCPPGVPCYYSPIHEVLTVSGPCATVHATSELPHRNGERALLESFTVKSRCRAISDVRIVRTCSTAA